MFELPKAGQAQGTPNSVVGEPSEDGADSEIHHKAHHQATGPVASPRLPSVPPHTQPPPGPREMLRPRPPFGGSSPLLVASKHGRLPVVEYLSTKGPSQLPLLLLSTVRD